MLPREGRPDEVGTGAGPRLPEHLWQVGQICSVTLRLFDYLKQDLKKRKPHTANVARQFYKAT